MCGNKLLQPEAPAGRSAAERELASTRMPWPPQEIGSVSGRGNRYEANPPSQSSESLRAAEDFLRKRPAPTPPPEPEPVPEYESEEPAAEIHGPSFLGLSGSESSSDYLLEDDGGGSSAVRVVFLLILLAAAAVVWWKWEPIKTYVWTQASMHSQEAKPATSEPQTDASTADSSKPAAQSVPQDDQPDMAAEPPAKPAPADAQPAAAAGTPPPAAEKTGDTAAASKPAVNGEAAATDKESTPNNAASSDKNAGKNAAKDESAANAESEPKADAKAQDEEADAQAPAPPARKAAPPKPQPDNGADLLAKAENYLYGRGGVPQSCRQALVYFKAAADKQNPSALSHVGAMYATGECGVRVDRVQAYKWFSKAYELQPGNHYLERNLTMLWREMSEQERQAITRPSATRGQ